MLYRCQFNHYDSVESANENRTTSNAPIMHPTRTLLPTTFAGFLCVLITTEVSRNYAQKLVGLPPGPDSVRLVYIMLSVLLGSYPYLHVVKCEATSFQLAPVGLKYHPCESITKQTNKEELPLLIKGISRSLTHYIGTIPRAQCYSLIAQCVLFTLHPKCLVEFTWCVFS